MEKDADALRGESHELASSPVQSNGQELQPQLAVKPRLKRRSAVIRLKEKLHQLKEKNEELIDKYRRLYADFDNYKKRAAKEWLEKNKEAGKDVIVPLLTILDDFERALKTTRTSDNLDSIREGTELIFSKLKKTLEQKGLEAMISIGQPFDPDRHDAVTEIAAPKEDDKGKVLDEIEKGYLLNGKIIRHAKVVVGK